MIFNRYLSKHVQEVMFSRKTNKISPPTSTFQTVPVPLTPCQKHLGLHLHEKLNFNQHISIKISKANKGFGIIKRLSLILPRKSLLTIYKSFLDHILITLMLYMTSQTMKVFVPILREYSTMLSLLLLVQ